MQRYVIENCSRIKKEKKRKIKIDKPRILLFHIAINSYLVIMNGKETLLRMWSHNQDKHMAIKHRWGDSILIHCYHVKLRDNMLSVSSFKS